MDVDSSHSGVRRVITKRHLMHAYNYTTDVQVAAHIGVTKQAVSRWGMDDPIPAKHQLALLLDSMGTFKMMM